MKTDKQMGNSGWHVRLGLCNLLFIAAISSGVCGVYIDWFKIINCLYEHTNRVVCERKVGKRKRKLFLLSKKGSWNSMNGRLGKLMRTEIRWCHEKFLLISFCLLWSGNQNFLFFFLSWMLTHQEDDSPAKIWMPIKGYICPFSG